MPTCLITGASGGVATALAEHLRAAGWRLALASRRAEELALADGDVAIVADVATVEVGQAPRLGGASRDGHEAVLGTALMIAGGNSRTVASSSTGWPGWPSTQGRTKAVPAGRWRQAAMRASISDGPISGRSASDTSTAPSPVWV